MTLTAKRRTLVLAVATLLSLAITSLFINATAIAAAGDDAANISTKDWMELLQRTTKVEDSIYFIMLSGGAIAAALAIVFGAIELFQLIKNKDSAKTLALVNDILKIAKDANERAQNSLMHQADIEREQLDNTVIRLIRDNNFFDVGAVMAQNNRQVRAAIVRGFDNLVRLDLFEKALGLPATPSCSSSFLKGMKYYFADDFEESLEHWRHAGGIGFTNKEIPTASQSISRGDNSLVSAVALYWAGHLQNNMGMYDRAERNFRAAMERLTDEADNEIGRCECERSVIEAKFFNKFRYSPTVLHNEVEETTQKTITDVAQARMHLLAGHIYYMSGIEGEKDTATDNFDKAIRQFNWIIENTNKDSKFALYAEFGYAQAWVALDKDPNAVSERLVRVRDRFRLDADNREELRSKTTSRTVEYVCERQMKERESNGTLEGLRRAIRDLVDRVDITLTVYSPISKRNVSKNTLIAELES